MKIATFSVKPEVGNGLESKILLFTNAGIGARKKKIFFSEGGLKSNLSLELMGTFKLGRTT